MNWKEFWTEVKKEYKSQIGVMTHDQFYDRILELRTRPETEHDGEDVPCTFCDWIKGK